MDAIKIEKPSKCTVKAMIPRVTKRRSPIHILDDIGVLNIK